MGTNRYQQRALGFSTAKKAITETQAQVERRLKRGYVEVPKIIEYTVPKRHRVVPCP